MLYVTKYKAVSASFTKIDFAIFCLVISRVADLEQPMGSGTIQELLKKLLMALRSNSKKDYNLAIVKLLAKFHPDKIAFLNNGSQLYVDLVINNPVLKQYISTKLEQGQDLEKYSPELIANIMSRILNTMKTSYIFEYRMFSEDRALLMPVVSFIDYYLKEQALINPIEKSSLGAIQSKLIIEYSPEELLEMERKRKEKLRMELELKVKDSLTYIGERFKKSKMDAYVEFAGYMLAGVAIVGMGIFIFHGFSIMWHMQSRTRLMGAEAIGKVVAGKGAKVLKAANIANSSVVPVELKNATTQLVRKIINNITQTHGAMVASSLLANASEKTNEAPNSLNLLGKSLYNYTNAVYSKLNQMLEETVLYIKNRPEAVRLFMHEYRDVFFWGTIICVGLVQTLAFISMPEDLQRASMVFPIIPTIYTAVAATLLLAIVVVRLYNYITGNEIIIVSDKPKEADIIDQENALTKNQDVTKAMQDTVVTEQIVAPVDAINTVPNCLKDSLGSQPEATNFIKPILHAFDSTREPSLADKSCTASSAASNQIRPRV